MGLFGRSYRWALATVPMLASAALAAPGLVAIPETTATAANSFGQAITSDGKYVVGTDALSTTSAYIYNTTNGNVYTFDRAALGRTGRIGTGVGYRTSGGVNQLLVHAGQSEGHMGTFVFDLSTEPGASGQWLTGNAVMLQSTANNTSSGTYNSLASQGLGTDLAYTIAPQSANSANLIFHKVIAGTSTLFTENTSGGKLTGGGVSYTGIAGYQKPQAGVNTAWTDVWGTAGGAFQGGAFSGYSQTAIFGMAANGTRVTGFNPATGLQPFAADMNPATGALTAVYSLPTIAGTTGQSVAYGLTANGQYAVGTNFSSTDSNQAVLWDLTNPNAPTVVNLNAWAASNGFLAAAGFSKLNKATSVGINGNGDLVITGYGSTTAPSFQRAFVLTYSLVPEPATLSLLALGALPLLRRRR